MARAKDGLGIAFLHAIFDVGPVRKRKPRSTARNQPAWECPRYGMTVQANTKSEARAALKKAVGPLPKGLEIRKRS